MMEGKNISNNLGSLSIMCWNINNFYSSTLNNKLHDQDFLQLTQDHDIIGLVETHSSENDDLFIPGFSKPYVKHRPKSDKSKAFGGIAVYVKPYLHNSIKITELNSMSKDILWIKLSQSGKTSPKFIGFAYISPERASNSEQIKKSFDFIQNDCIKYSAQGDILIPGDLSARTNCEPDVLSPESPDAYVESKHGEYCNALKYIPQPNCPRVN